MENSYLSKVTIDELIEEIKYVYMSDDRPWIIGYSGGKDSTTVVILVYKMLKDLEPSERKKNVYIVSSDTLVENPIIKIYLDKMNKLLGEAATRDNIPMKSIMVKPEASNSFWANVIGRGFPTPRLNGTFRWCTDRLKILPSSKFMQEVIDKEDKEVVVLLGVRKAESIARKTRIEGREIKDKLFSRHEVIDKAYVYNPIVELTTDDVWDILLNYDNGKTPWGASNSELVEMYSDADSGECPFAGMSQSGGQAQQSCGQSRFGCWICTVVKEDKSLNGFIKSGYRELIPIAEFRKWLMSIRDLDEFREKKGRQGTIYKTKDGELGYGPFNWKARKIILKRLLETQKAMDYELITLDELKAIDEIWDNELDISRRTLVETYYQVIGEKLPWHDLKRGLLDDETISLLEEVAHDEDVPYDLIRNMVLTAYKNKNYSNSKILRDSLDKLLKQQWLHYEVLKEIFDED